MIMTQVLFLARPLPAGPQLTKTLFPSQHPLHCIVPPHMLKEIVRRGDAEQKEWALETLTASARLRGNREILGELLGLFPSGGDQKRRTVYDARGGETLPGVRIRG